MLVLALAGCQPDSVRVHEPDAYPERLSAWGLVQLNGGELNLNTKTTVYQLNTGLFSDYALKLRTVYLPGGTQASYDPDNVFNLPVGSIISKTFLYAKDESERILTQASWRSDPADFNTKTHRLMETRLLVRQSHGWDALPYIWNGNDAYLSITGGLEQVPLASGGVLNYLIPSKNQCASCHATDHTSGALQPIGIRARHLNREVSLYGMNQLDYWQQTGLLHGFTPAQREAAPANAVWGEDNADLAHRARSYLDINCGHCHNERGAADTSGLLLDYADHPMGAMGYCKPPIAAGRGAGGFLYSIVPGQADQSILSFRMATTDPGMMMPELGRSLVHDEAVALVYAWIDQLSGECK